VTAWHVYDAYLQRLMKRRPFACQFGAVTVFPETRLIAESKSLDLATFDLADVTGALEGFAPSRPLVWPPARPAIDDLVIYGGFPGKMRRSDLIKATFPLDSVTGLVSQVTAENLVIELDYLRLTDADGPHGNVVSTDPAGTSGGPVCRITGAPGLEIVGFIYEQHHQTGLSSHAMPTQSHLTVASQISRDIQSNTTETGLGVGQTFRAWNRAVGEVKTTRYIPALNLLIVAGDVCPDWFGPLTGR
jgi:hypothetical protein